MPTVAVRPRTPRRVNASSRGLFACYLIAVAATPFPGNYWVLVVLSAMAVLNVTFAGHALFMSRWLLVVLGWFAVSGIWSVAPSLTARNGLLIALMSAAASFMVAALGPVQSLRALLVACRVLLVASWAAYLLVPSVGRTQEVYQTGALEGIFVQRNVAAFFCVVAIISFVIAAAVRLDGVAPGRASAWAVAAFCTLLATSSSTGLAVLLACAGVLALLVLASRAQSPPRRRALAATAVLPIVGLALWLPYNLGIVSELFGRDATLTGRSVIWAVVENEVALAPWGGYGYGALWTAGVPLTERMWSQAGFAFYHAHSAYWDYLAQIGVVGLLLVLTILLATTWRAVRALIQERAPIATWPISICICLLLYAIDEQSFASQFGWVLLVMASTMMLPAAKEKSLVGPSWTRSGHRPRSRAGGPMTRAASHPAPPAFRGSGPGNG